MKEYFDTPVLVFACANTGELGKRARQLIAACPNPVTTPHTLAECFNALTHRLGFPAQAAREVIEQNTRRFEFVVLDADDYRVAMGRVVDNGLTGDKIYDALHVRAAEKSQSTKIRTSNKRDFDPLTTAIPVERIGP